MSPFQAWLELFLTTSYENFLLTSFSIVLYVYCELIFFFLLIMTFSTSTIQLPKNYCGIQISLLFQVLKFFSLNWYFTFTS